MVKAKTRVEAMHSERASEMPDGWNFVLEDAGGAPVAIQSRPLVNTATPATLAARHTTTPPRTTSTAATEAPEAVLIPGVNLSQNPPQTNWPWSRSSFQHRIQLQSEQSRTDAAAAGPGFGGDGGEPLLQRNTTAVTWVDVSTTPPSTLSVSYPELVRAADNAARIVSEALQSRLEATHPGVHANHPAPPPSADSSSSTTTTTTSRSSLTNPAVGLCLDNGLPMVACQLGVAWAGGHFVPLNRPTGTDDSHSMHGGGNGNPLATVRGQLQRLLYVFYLSSGFIFNSYCDDGAPPPHQRPPECAASHLY